jgi:hypothetical protein
LALFIGFFFDKELDPFPDDTHVVPSKAGRDWTNSATALDVKTPTMSRADERAPHHPPGTQRNTLVRATIIVHGETPVQTNDEIPLPLSFDPTLFSLTNLVDTD